jgi:polyhydroxyalkanoate synthesis repressor PhaR
MAKNDGQIVIKKYANRRLYNTGTSTYVTLDDLAQMVKKGEDFTVQDAKSGDDITHSVLTQIIFEQESKNGNTLLPISFLRQLISYYGDQMQMFVPSPISSSPCTPSRSQQSPDARASRQIARRYAARQEPADSDAADGRAGEAQHRDCSARRWKMFTPFAPHGARPSPSPRARRTPRISRI